MVEAHRTWTIEFAVMPRARRKINPDREKPVTHAVIDEADRENIADRVMRPNVTTLNQIFDTIKNAAVALVGLFALLLVGVVLIRSFNTSDITFDSVKVPESFSEVGYTSEITTTQILDEVSKIHAQSSTSISNNKKNIGGYPSGDSLSRLASLPGAGGIDFKTIQTLIQETFGIRTEKITGEITAKNKGEEITYHVRIRVLPENKLLVDFSKQTDIPDLIKETALRLVERLEPTVAASYYRLNKDNENALRMVDEALRDDDVSDDVIARAQRAQIFVQQGKFDLAQADLNLAFASDPKSPQALNVQSNLYNHQKKYKEALETAKLQSEVWSDRWNPYANMALAYTGLGNDAEAELNYVKAISLVPRSVMPHLEAAKYFADKGKIDLAERTLNQGLKKFPDDISLLVSYSVLSINAHRYEQAALTLSKAMKIDPINPLLWSTVLQLPDGIDQKLKDEVAKKVADSVKDSPDSGVLSTASTP